MALSDYDRDILTRTAIGEADMHTAIVQDILDRAATQGSTVGDVALARGRYSSWDTPRRNLRIDPKSEKYQQVAQLVDNMTSDAPDLLGSWVKSDAPAKSTKAAPEDDLLGAWVTSDKTIPESAYAPVAAAPAKAAAPGAQETLPQAAARYVAEHPGDSVADRLGRLGAGVMRGGGDVADTLAQGIAATGETGANALARAGIISPASAGAVRDWRAGVNARVAQGQQAFSDVAGDSDLASAGRIGGNIVASAPLISAGGGALAAATRGAPLVSAVASRPLISSALKAAGVGGAANALTSAASNEPVLDQVLSGAATGAVLGPVGSKLSGALGGAVDRGTAALAQAARNQYGIKVGAGQISANPTVRFLDSVLQRLPFTGYGARTAAQQTALNRAVASEMGVTADKITPDVVRQAQKTAYADYDAAKAGMGHLDVDAKFYSDLHDVHDNAHYTLEPLLAARVDSHLNNVLDKVVAGKTIDPDLYQSLTRHGGPLDNAINSKDSKISTYAASIKDALENLVGRNDPALKQLKDAADYKYFVAKSVEGLAHEAPTGDISPAKLLRSVDNSETAVGELGRIAKRFLVEPPSSGTAERSMILQHLTPAVTGALGAGALGSATYFEPESWQRNALLAAGTIGAGRLGARALRGNLLANEMIRSGLRGAPGRGSDLLNLALPAYGAIATKRNPLLQGLERQ
jgi:hypothetical protein